LLHSMLLVQCDHRAGAMLPDFACYVSIRLCSQLDFFERTGYCSVVPCVWLWLSGLIRGTVACVLCTNVGVHLAMSCCHLLWTVQAVLMCHDACCTQEFKPTISEGGRICSTKASPNLRHHACQLKWQGRPGKSCNQQA
jgi:hypothetical protein